MKIKMMLTKKIQQRRPLKFLNATKAARFSMPRTLEIAFQSFLGGGIPTEPPRGKGPYTLTAPLVFTAAYYTFSGHLSLQLMLLKPLHSSSSFYILNLYPSG